MHAKGGFSFVRAVSASRPADFDYLCGRMMGSAHGYTVSEVSSAVMLSHGEGRPRSRIESISNHYILCGFGGVGEEIAREFTTHGLDFIIVESSPEAIERAGERGYLLLEGNATGDEILREAGIERAQCLLSASDSDADNVAVVLAAKALSPGTFIVSFAGSQESAAGIRRAGADRVFSPYIAVGRRMALSALQPILMSLADTSAVERGPGVLAEIEIAADGGLAGRTIEEVLATSPTIVVLAIRRASGEVSVAPKRKSNLNVGDAIIVMGPQAELEAIHR